MWNEFSNTTTEELEIMIAEITREARKMEEECNETSHPSDRYRCDYAAIDLWVRRDEIRAELQRRIEQKC